MVILLFVQSSSFASWTVDGNTYTKRKKVTISNANVDATLTDFPLKVAISSDSAIGAVCQADGDDIRFTASDGTTLLYKDPETFSVVGGSAVATMFVKVPSVATSADTDIYIYYGNSGASAQTGSSSAWDASFVGVWHMNDNAASTAVVESKAGRNGTSQTNTSSLSANGKVGKALNFVKTTPDYVEVGNDASWEFGSGEFYVSFWYYTRTTSPVYGVALSRDRTSTYSPWFFCYPNQLVNWQVYMTTNGSAWNIAGPQLLISSPAVDTWYYFTIRRVGDNYYLYNAATQNATWGYSGAIYANSNAMCFGSGQSGVYLNGYLDEIRITKGSGRSAEWQKFEYYNMATEAGQLTFGTEEVSAATTPAGRRRVIMQ